MKNVSCILGLVLSFGVATQSFAVANDQPVSNQQQVGSEQQVSNASSGAVADVLPVAASPARPQHTVSERTQINALMSYLNSSHSNRPALSGPELAARVALYPAQLAEIRNSGQSRQWINLEHLKLLRSFQTGKPYVFPLFPAKIVVTEEVVDGDNVPALQMTSEVQSSTAEAQDCSRFDCVARPFAQ